MTTTQSDPETRKASSIGRDGDEFGPGPYESSSDQQRRGMGEDEGPKHEAPTENPKLASAPGTNTVKDPSDWVSGDEPMTGAQSSYLKTLSEEAGEAEAFDANLSKAEASRRVDQLKSKLGLSLAGRPARRAACPG